MTNFEELIKSKTNEELIEILICSQNYQSEYIELVKKELKEIRNISSESFKEFIQNKTDDELIDYHTQSADYQPVFIEAVKKELTQNRHIDIDSIQHKEKIYAPKNKRSGWLTFFLFVIGIGGVISPIIGFLTMSLSDYDAGLGHWFSVVGVICDSILLIGLAFLAFYTIKSFNNYKPNAIALGKAYLIIVFATNLLSLIGGDYQPTGFNSLSHTIARLIGQTAWFLYLSYSKELKFLFPKEKRKLFKRDKIILFSIVFPALIWLLVIFASTFSSNYISQSHMDNTAINQNSLSGSEYTDGRIIFEQPDGLTLEKQIYEGHVYYTLNQEDNISITLYSEYDNNDTEEYFEECMSNWTDETYNEFDYIVKDEQHFVREGSSYRLKTVQYDSEPPIEWTFVLIFNQETKKCCLLSYYSMIDTDYLSDLIHSIRFK